MHCAGHSHSEQGRSCSQADLQCRTWKGLQRGLVVMQGSWGVQRAAEREKPQRRSSMRELLAELHLFFAYSVAALKAPLHVYLFWKWIKQNCRMICRAQCPHRDLMQKSHCSQILCPQCSLLHVVERWQQQGEEKREGTAPFDAWW